MNKTIKQIALLGAFLVSAPQALAGAIDTCSFDGWNKSSFDGSDYVSSSDFNATGTSPDCSLEVTVGDTLAWSNSLSHNLIFDGAFDSSYLLSVDFNFFDSANSPGMDSLFIALSDGTGKYFDETGEEGSLFEIDIDGADTGHIEVELDSSFFGQTGWFLDFQMNDFWDYDGLASTLSINSFSFTELPAEVPEPTSLAIFALGFAGLMARRKHANELVRKSFNK